MGFISKSRAQISVGKLIISTNLSICLVYLLSALSIHLLPFWYLVKYAVCHRFLSSTPCMLKA